jgi:hypothetical protein
MDSSVGIIKRRVVWSIALGIGIPAGSSFLIDSVQNIESVFGVDIPGNPTYTPWLFATYFVSAVSWSGISFALISLINVLADFVSKRGVNDQIVGVVGGVLFWVGVDILNLILVPLAIEGLSMEVFSIEILGVGALLTVVGLALMVKG